MPGPSGTCPTYQCGPQLYPPLPYPMSMQFNTGLGDIGVQSSIQWSAPYWPYPYINASTFETEFRLCFRTGNISVCNRCRNKFDKKSKTTIWSVCTTRGMAIIRVPQNKHARVKIWICLLPFKSSLYYQQVAVFPPPVIGRLLRCTKQTKSWSQVNFLFCFCCPRINFDLKC